MADPIVTIKQGQLKGTTDTNLDGGTYLKFSGIPFAKPPVGSLRFKAPQPAEPWTGVRDATVEGGSCVAFDFMSQQTIGTEDCLYLNVFTKELPKPGQSPKPVMVYLHGGAFTMGSASEQMYGSKYLLTQDIVLVTTNYRLGVFGFLSSDDTSLEVPGNAGLKDQTFALKWVQENISSFNGDPNNVTIFGVSAGGASVHFQILSPTAKGLFHKAISQSGSSLNPWAWGQKNAIQLAEQLGHVVSTEKEAIEVLLKASALELSEASTKIPDFFADTSKRRPYGPVIEKPNPTAFLSENPSDLLASGRYNQVPTVMGLVDNEGLIYELFTQRLKSPEVDPFECGIPWNLGLEEGSDKRAKVKKLIKNFYFRENKVTNEELYEVIGDSSFLVGIIESIKLALKNSSSPIYSYLFTYDTPPGSVMKTFYGFDERTKGVAHGGDQMFLFSTMMTAAFGVQIEEQEKQAINDIVKIWTDFAKTGKPHEQWEPVEDGNFRHFNINKEVGMNQGPPFAERVAFWEKVLKEVTSIDASYNAKAKL